MSLTTAETDAIRRQAHKYRAVIMNILDNCSCPELCVQCRRRFVFNASSLLALCEPKDESDERQ